MKLRFIITPLLLASFLLMCSCCSEDIRFNKKVINKRIPLLSLNDTTLPYAEVSISFTYPVKFRDKTSLTRLQQIFTGTFFNDINYDSITPLKAVSHYIDSYSERYQSLSNNYYKDKFLLKGESPTWYWYTLNLRNEVLYMNDSLLCMAVSFSNYEGGAQELFRVTYTNIDLNHLYTLTEEDLFIPGYYKPLAEKIVCQLMDDYHVTSPDSLLKKGFFNIEDIVPNNNFWLSDSAIHYTFNQHEIAPSSMDAIDVTIPYSRLEDLLSSNTAVPKHLR